MREDHAIAQVTESHPERTGVQQDFCHTSPRISATSSGLQSGELSQQELCFADGRCRKSKQELIYSTSTYLLPLGTRVHGACSTQNLHVDSEFCLCTQGWAAISNAGTTHWTMRIKCKHQKLVSNWTPCSEWGVSLERMWCDLMTKDCNMCILCWSP